MQKINPTFYRNIFLPAKAPPLHNLLNLWTIEDDAIIGLDLQMSFMYEITPQNLLHKSNDEIDVFLGEIKRFLQILPDNVLLQFWVQIRTGDDDKITSFRNNIKSTDDLSKLVVDEKIKYFKNSFIQRKKFFLVITNCNSLQNKLISITSNPFKIINKNYIPITKHIHETRILKLKEIAQTLITTLKNLGFEPIRLKEKEIISILYEYLNPSRAGLLDLKKILANDTLRSQICLNACENEFDHIYLDGFYYRTVNLYTRPESVDFIMLNNLLSVLLPDCDVCISLDTGNQEKLIKEIQNKGTVAKNISNLMILKRNYEAESRSMDCDQMVEDVKTSFQKVFNYSLAVILRERSLEELTIKTNETIKAFRLLGEAEGIIDDMNHLPVFLSVLPNNIHLNFRKHIFQASAIAEMLPITTPWIGCNSPKMIFKTDDDQLLPIDLFEQEITSSAKNGLIIGCQGSGKSFATNYVLSNFFVESEKNHMVIIDVGGSYRKLCALFHGDYLEIDLSGKYAFNPFPSKSTAVLDTDSFKVDADVLEFITLLVQKMLQVKELSGREQKLLENAIVSTYKFSKSDPPLLQSLHYQLMNYEGDQEDKKTARNFGKNLEIWTSGRYGELINRPSTINPTSRLVVFDLQKLDEQPQLQSIVFFLIQSVIENKLKNRELQKMLVIDEGWKFFQDPVGSKLIINLYKTIRKFRGLVWSISQSPKDFLDTLAADSIVTNSIIKVILRLESGYEILEKFKLNLQEIETAKNLRASSQYREAFLKFGSFSRVIKIEPSPIDYWICTTNAVDFMKEKQFRNLHPDFTEVQILEGLAKGGTIK